MTAAAIDVSHGGICHDDWLPVVGAMAPWPATGSQPSRLVVVAPHPDDETLGVGGFIAAAALRGVPAVVISVTDGEAAPVTTGLDGLGERRHSELLASLRVLSPDRGCTVHRLRLPDGRVLIHAETLRDRLQAVIEPGDLILGPLECDGHPDHDATGEAVRSVAEVCGADFGFYPVWAWHWHHPHLSLVGERGRRFDLSPDLVRVKADAINCYASQTEGPEPVLPAHFVGRFATPWEVLVVP